MHDLAKFEERLGVSFADKELLRQALVHRSYLNENPQFHLPHNERLEFLGDAVIELVVTEYLYQNYPNPEGELTNWRAALVNAKMLAKIARELLIEDYLLLSRGEAKDTGRARQFILANALEAVVGAVYLDRGYEVVRSFVARTIIGELPRVLAEKLYRDPKSRFQEESQEKLGVTPRYEVLQEWGPDHEKCFRVGVFLNAMVAGEGEGSSKQEAEERAAEDALSRSHHSSRGAGS